MDSSIVRIPEKFKDHSLFNDLICGTNFGFMARRGYYARPEALKQPEIMRKSGINWTTLNMNICQTHFAADRVFLDFEFSTGELELAEMVKRLHDNGIKVLFKPCLTPLDGAWMGDVRFPGSCNQIQSVPDCDYWGKWFKSFTEAAKYFSELAQKIGIDAIIIGAEYYGTEGQNAHWENVIKEVRSRFDGPITYEFTYASRRDYDLEWFKGLDFLSYSYYPPACEIPGGGEPTAEDARNNPKQTIEGMQEFLSSRKNTVTKISDRFWNMPIVFTEYGVRSAHGCSLQPYNFMWDTPYDGQEQADYMEASFRTFWELPQWMGFFWWKWDETQIRPQYHGDPGGDRGFTIQGKPAEDVMRKWVQMKR